MPVFSADSRAKLATIKPPLRELMEEAIQHVDFTIVWGARTPEEQNELYRKGFSKRDGYINLSNHQPDADGMASAVDIAPWPVDWRDEKRFYLLAGFILCLAFQRGIRIRWGGDWDRDLDLNDQSFNDLAHYELVEG